MADEFYNKDSNVSKDIERIANAKKLMETPSEENCLKVIRILEEIEASGCSDPSWAKQQKKNVIVMYITLVETKGLECINKKQYSQGVKILDGLGDLILHHAEDLGIGKQAMILFITEFVNDKLRK